MRTQIYITLPCSLSLAIGSSAFHCHKFNEFSHLPQFPQLYSITLAFTVNLVQLETSKHRKLNIHILFGCYTRELFIFRRWLVQKIYIFTCTNYRIDVHLFAQRSMPSHLWHSANNKWQFEPTDTRTHKLMKFRCTHGCWTPPITVNLPNIYN